MPLIRALSATEAHGWQTTDPCHMHPQQYYSNCGSENCVRVFYVSRYQSCVKYSIFGAHGGGPLFPLNILDMYSIHYSALSLENEF
jgi:hypothetical protein